MQKNYRCQNRMGLLTSQSTSNSDNSAAFADAQNHGSSVIYFWIMHYKKENFTTVYCYVNFVLFLHYLNTSFSAHSIVAKIMEILNNHNSLENHPFKAGCRVVHRSIVHLEIPGGVPCLMIGSARSQWFDIIKPSVCEILECVLHDSVVSFCSF